MGKDKTILIVDDEKLNIELLVEYLKELNCNFISVESGEKAINYFKENKVDLVLLDIMLPKMNGYEVCKKIKSDYKKDIPVIFISTLDEGKDIAKGFNVGGSDYITKPFKKEVVKARVKNHLDFYDTKKEFQIQNKQQEILLENIDAQIWYLKNSSTYGKVNKNHAEFLGFNKGEIENKKLIDFLAEEEAKICIKNNKLVVDKKKKIKSLEWVENNDGEKRLLDITKEPVFDNDGNIEYIVATAFDITEKKKQQQRIRDKKRLLENLAENVPGAIYQYQLFPNGNSRFPYASKGIYKIYEVEPKEVKEDASKVFERLHSEDYHQVADSIKKSADNLTIWHEEYRVVLPQKGNRWVEGYARPEKMDDGSILWHGYIRDITYKVSRRKLIDKQKNRLNWIINGTDAGTWEWNIRTGETKFNKKWAEMLGYSLEEISPTNIETWYNLTHPDDLKKAERELKKHFKGESDQYNTEIRMKHKNGNWKWVNDRGKVTLWGEENNPIKMYVVHIDIDKRKKHQKRLEIQLEFQKTLAQISSNLLEVNSVNMDIKINNALKKIGEFFEVDRSYIFEFSEENKFMSNTHEWCEESVKPQKDNLQKLSSNVFSWWMKKLSRNEYINISDVRNMVEEAKSEQKILQQQNIKSTVVMPMFIENELFGFFGFDSVKNKKNFSEEEIRLLKIFTDVITSAFSKHIDNKKIRDLTFKDNLTGLYNRRFFEAEIERLDVKRQLPLSIIMADINGLKIINDSLGHKKGDEVLIKSAEILKEETRDEDILARYGGDEFVLLLPQTDKKESEKIIKRIKRNSKNTKADKLQVSIALGFASKLESQQNIIDILKKADNNMYQNKLSESKSTKNKIVQGLLNTLVVKSEETKEHALRMSKLASAFGNELGLPNSELNRLSLLSKLHDIGKTTIEEKILKKPGKLTEKEWEIMKEHPERGSRIANSSEEFALIAEEIYTHHERWDGNGYPRQLKGNEIPYLARIISIIDAYDVMTHERSYKDAVPIEEALKEINICAGSQFDPDLANKFMTLVNKSNLNY